MNFVRIFEPEVFLLSAIFDDDRGDEFNRIFEQWTDIEFLDNFFNKNKEDLKLDTWKRITVDQAIIETSKEARAFQRKIGDLKDKSPVEIIQFFSNLFKPLDNQQSRFDYLDKKKAYGLRSPSWLRIYALKVGEDMYIITGGAIKLTATMSERRHTLEELDKLARCRQFLMDEGILDKDGMTDYLEI